MKNLLDLFYEMESVLEEIGVCLEDLIEGNSTAMDLARNVRICGAHQPNWPLAEDVSHFSLLSKDFHEDEIFDEDEINDTIADDLVCWIILNGHPYDMSPYAPKSLFSDR